MEKLLLFSILIILVGPPTVQAQNNSSPQTVSKIVQPKIVVIPRVPADGDMKALYDTSLNIQKAMSKLNEAFLTRGANLVSFDALLKQARQNIAMNRSSGNQEDFKSSVLSLSGADIYVEAKLDIVRHASRNAHSVTVILEGFQNGTSNLLGSKAGHSRINQTEDIGFLIMQAVDSIVVGFLELMQLKFDDIRENGQSVYVEFSLGPNSKYDFESEVGTDKKLLFEVIEEWFHEHAYKSVFNSQGVTANKMILSDVRIPLKNPSNPKFNYTTQSFYSDILKLFRTINIPIKREFGDNNKILITIQ